MEDKKLSGFICHDDYLAKISRLTDEEVGRLFRALMKYHITHEAEEIDGRECLAYDFIREDIDIADKKYDEKCKKNRQTRLDAIENERQRTLTDVSECDHTIIDNNIQDNNRQDKDNTKNNKFVPPTLEEVKAYMAEVGCNVDPQYFLDYQEARNWVLSNGKKAKDWKAVIRTWKHNNFTRQPTSGTSGVKKVVAQQYTQREYENTQAEAEERTLSEARRWMSERRV